MTSSPDQPPPPVFPDKGDYTGPPPTDDAKTLAVIAHVLNFVILVPLLVYLLKKDSHPFVADQSKEALNFSLCWLIVHVILLMTFCLFITTLLHFPVMLFQIIMGIIAAVNARDGVPYRYPFTFRIL